MRPVSASASGRLGVIKVARGRTRRFMAMHRFGLEQRCAAFGDHHRIDDERDDGASRFKSDEHGFDDLARAQHAGLDRVGADVARARL